MPAKKLYRSTVKSVSIVARATYVLQLDDAELSRSVAAGQFIEIQVPHCSEILWRRPFSIHNTEPKNHTVEVLFNAIGRGTATLTSLEPNSELEILGPLGNSFTYAPGLKEAIVVAGGLGIAPFMLMQKELAERKIPMRLFYGVGAQDQFCRLDQFEKYATLHLCTMDGSRGHHGLVTDALTDYLKQPTDLSDKCLFVCGPTPMLKKVQEIAQALKVAAQVSVETIMACGFGACVGCAVPMTHPIPGKKEYYLACKDGPVFDINEITIDD